MNDETLCINPLTKNMLECLNSWPEGTVGYNVDKQLINMVHLLCLKHGYGRMSQLIQGMEEIWQDPVDGHAKWQKFHDAHMELLKGTIEYYKEKS